MFARFRAKRKRAGAECARLLVVQQVLEQAARRLELVLGLSSHAAERALAEVLDCFDSAVDDHIRTRHAELQRAGYSNDSIFSLIADELGALRFKAPALSARQIRRRIYG